MIIKGNLVGNVSPRTNWNQTNSARADYLVGREKIVESISDAKKTGSDALINSKAYTNEQIKKARPYNLLKNSNFADPVNTKGAASYKGAVEGIDRWEMTVPQWMVSVEDGCIKISDNPDVSTTKVGMFRQTIAVPSNLRGKTVTFVAKIKGNGMTRININNTSIGDYTFKDANGVEYSNDVWHIRSLTGVVPDTGDTFYVALQSRNMEPWYCEWVALYEGEYTADNLPDYQPKGYMVEAMDCGALNVGHKFTLETTGWYAVNSVYQKDVNVTGLLTEDTVYIDLAIPSETKDLNTIEEIEEEFSKIYDVLIGNGAMSIRAKEIPTIALPIKIRMVR